MITEAGLRYEAGGGHILSAKGEGGWGPRGPYAEGWHVNALDDHLRHRFLKTIETICMITACQDLGIILHVFTEL